MMTVYPTDAYYSGPETGPFALLFPHCGSPDKLQILYTQMKGIMIQPNIVLKEIKI